MSRISTQPRIFPNGITIESVEVVGELLPDPVLFPFSLSGSGSGSGSGSACSNFSSNDSISNGSGLYPDEYTNPCNQTQEANDRPDNEEPEFIMIVSEFQVSFSVLDCGYRLPLLMGYYEVEGYAPMTTRVDIELVKLSL